MRIILVGGFLGAGKTTLLWEAARRLTERGSAVGLITNDQAPDLVDTALLKRSGSKIREVAGSCFCCNFNGFRDAVRSLADAGAQIVIAEPVGSCTDLAATIVRPLQKLHPEYEVAPLSVLIDPIRIDAIMRNAQSLLHSDAVYILQKQLEEAELILISKSDSMPESNLREIRNQLSETCPNGEIRAVSSITGSGIDEWLDLVMRSESSATGLAEIDYDRYAHGEAVLGWLNAVVNLNANQDGSANWETAASELMHAIQQRLQETGNEIGHIKMILTTSSGEVVANLTGLYEEITIRSQNMDRTDTAKVTINARVQIAPKLIERIVRDSLIRVCSNQGLTSVIRTLHCLQPGRPVPTHRYVGGTMENFQS